MAIRLGLMTRMMRERSPMTGRAPRASLRGAVRLRCACLGLVGLLCVMAIEGHLAGIGRLYSLTGSAIFSIPTILAASLAIGALLLQHLDRRSGPLERALWAGVMLVAVGAQLLHAWGIRIGPGEMGRNTAITLGFLALGQMMYARWRVAPFVLTIFAMPLPFTALVGYLFGRNELFGNMSLQTSVVLLALGLACAVRFARRRSLRALIGTSLIGRLARRSLLGCLGWLVIEALALDFLPPRLRESGLFFFIVLSSIVFLIGVLVLAMFAEEWRRRHERDELALARALERDPVTGLHYRGLGDLYMRTHARTGPVGMMMIGVDNWDWIVLDGGRAVAEHILLRLANVLGQAIDCDDLLLRWDDRRFLILSHRISAETLEPEAERVRDLINLPGTLGQGLADYTASVGAAIGPHGKLTLQPAVSHALAAVRAAEKSGAGRPVLDRNVIRLDPPGRRTLG